MSTFDIIQTTIIFGSGCLFAGPMACLFTYATVQDKVQREEMLRWQREQHEKLTIIRMQEAARKVIPLPPRDNGKVSVREVPMKPTYQMDVPQDPKVIVANKNPRVHPNAPVLHDETRIDPIPPVVGRRHGLPSRSPLVSVTMSLTAGSGGWAVTGKQAVTDTDLISLKAIRELVGKGRDGEDSTVSGSDLRRVSRKG